MWKPPEHQLPVSTSKGGFESGAGVKWRSGKVAPKGVKAFPLRSPFHFNLGAGPPAHRRRSLWEEVDAQETSIAMRRTTLPQAVRHHALP